MFDFAHPILLYMLLAAPAFFGLYLMARAARRRKLRRFGKAEVISHLMPEVSRYKPAIKITVQLLALAAIIIVIARPRAGEAKQETTTAGIEIMVAFDVSNSMLASGNDDPGGTSRLDRARLLLEKLIDKLSDDKVGLIVFAGEAKTQLPLTTDFYSAKMYLSELSPAMITAQGTSIAEALKMSMNAFSSDDKVHKAIILITDSEDHEGEAVETAKLAAENGIQINVIGLGSAKGAPIPVYGKPGEYMRDASGALVTTTLNEALAQQIAKAGKGIYVNGAASSALSSLQDQLNTLQKSEFARINYTAGAEQFPVFAWIALILLIIDIIIVERKISWLQNINFFSK